MRENTPLERCHGAVVLRLTDEMYTYLMSRGGFEQRENGYYYSRDYPGISTYRYTTKTGEVFLEHLLTVTTICGEAVCLFFLTDHTGCPVELSVWRENHRLAIAADLFVRSLPTPGSKPQ